MFSNIALSLASPTYHFAKLILVTYTQFLILFFLLFLPPKRTGKLVKKHKKRADRSFL